MSERLGGRLAARHHPATLRVSYTSVLHVLSSGTPQKSLPDYLI